MVNPLEEVLKNAGMGHLKFGVPKSRQQKQSYRPPSGFNSQMQSAFIPQQQQLPVPQQTISQQPPIETSFQTEQPPVVPKNSYIDKLIQIESGGKYTAHNKGSGAYGLGQFLPGTAKPILSDMGKNWEQYKTDPNLQRQVLSKFTDDNVAGLKSRNIPVNGETLWWAHNQGLGGANALYNNGNINQRNLSANGGSGGPQAYKDRWHNTFIDTKY